MSSRRERRRAIAAAAKQAGVRVISRSPERNSQMVVINGKTQHVPIDPTKPMKPAGHKHMEKTYQGRIDPRGHQKPAHEAPAEGFEFDNRPLHII